ncbi:MAG: DegT/DnrJ/EryC1/StrS family aminotransferase, partial [Thermodesulfobacteriota bacterium]|nr:DegT/DnrJ/EryC1/StrS family aminotransferase [Thermodesulfobacteriota bacterium]
GFEIIDEEEKMQILDVLSRKILFRYEFDEQREGIYKVEEFEKAFARYCGVDYALGVSSGTAALKVALAALGIGPGDEVITQGFTFVATWEAILDAGAIPVFSEIDDTLCLDPNDIQNKISSRTKAIIPVHMCGAQASINEILALADRNNIPVIEDTAQSCGGRLNGKSLGSFGKIGTFSFDSVKTMTTGEGGMIITDDRDLYIRASEYHDHGHDHNPNVGRGLEKRNFIGSNYRMMELQGALGLAQLKKLDNIILARQRKNKNHIKEVLSNIDGITFRNILDPEGDTATFLIFFLPTVEKTEAFNRVMIEEGVGAIYWYANLWHYYEEWEHLLKGRSFLRNGYPFKTESGKIRCRYERSDLPITAEILSRALTIPININMQVQMPKMLKAIEKAARVI